MELSGWTIVSFLGRGLLMGLAIAAPVGPIGVLCIRRTLAYGRWVGLLSGLGAATADGIYGCIAGFGLTFISNFLQGYAFWISFLGGLYLCYLGVKTFLSRPTEEAADASATGLLAAYGSTVLLTLTNPATILSFVTLFAGIGLVRAEGDYLSASALVLGVFLGSALWWVLLSGGVSIFRDRFNLQGLRWMNRISGLILIGFGAVALSLNR
ncbi:MAG: LysE family transporter [Elainellaceae cyanobacterium]